ncbi:MAG: hypothetical protein KDD37_07320 [Bdellovibrionales bacterium]|nr:hypothetical protein [Bdellovibrionales bacterium]
MKYTLALLLIASVSHADLINDNIKIGSATVGVQLETETGDYALELEKLIRPYLTLQKEQLVNTNCKGEREFAIAMGSEFEASNYSLNRKPVAMEFNLVEPVDTPNVEQQIRAIAKNRGYKIDKLNNVSQGFATSLALRFKWEPRSIVKKGGEKLIQSIETELNSQLVKGKNVETKFHAFVCDIQDGNVKVSVDANFSISNRMRIAGSMSAKQVRVLYQRLQSKNMNQASQQQEDSSNYTYKAIRAATTMAYETFKMGFTDSFILSGDFTKVFNSIYEFNDFSLEPLSGVDFEAISSNLNHESAAQNERNISIVDRAVNLVEE